MGLVINAQVADIANADNMNKEQCNDMRELINKFFKSEVLKETDTFKDVNELSEILRRREYVLYDMEEIIDVLKDDYITSEYILDWMSYTDTLWEFYDHLEKRGIILSIDIDDEAFYVIKQECEELSLDKVISLLVRTNNKYQERIQEDFFACCWDMDQLYEVVECSDIGSIFDNDSYEEFCLENNVELPHVSFLHEGIYWVFVLKLDMPENI